MIKSVGSDPASWEGNYIRFELSAYPPENKKTQVWIINSKKGDYLGEVKWFSRWRKYSFFPAPDCIFEEVCLGDIADFLKWATDAHKNGV